MILFRALFLLPAILLAACQSVPLENQRKPNILIILSDDQGWGDFSILGNKNIKTPNIDGLAKEGALFNNFYVEAVCSPTRAELLTGRYHQRAGVYSTSAGGERIDLDEYTLAEAFKEAGYATAAYGKWHSGMQPPYHPNSRGFDDFYGFCSGHWGSYFSPMLEHNGAIVKGEGFLVDDLTKHGIEFMEKNRDKPFLLYLPFNTPHSPMQVPDRWFDKFQNLELEMFATNPEQEDLAFTRAALAMCENIDWNVGRILQSLEELGLEENTIVIYFNDNGPNSWRWNGGMKGRKGSTDEGGVRTPLFVKWPGKVKKGLVLEELASVIDLMPTLSDMAGLDLKVEKPLDGLSLKSLLLEENTAREERYIFNQWKENISVRSQKFRLDSKGALFDIENDRAQKEDVAKEFPDIHKAHLEARARYIEEIASELPEEDLRPFTLGYPEARYTQIPARDGLAHGHIRRSNIWPNCSFFTNWISTNDSITWDLEVLQEGNFKVTLYYTCPEGDEGSRFRLTLGKQVLEAKIESPFDPPLRGMENDRAGERGESYVKDFKPLNLGVWHLDKGKGQLSLSALEIPGHTVMDFRLLLFERLPCSSREISRDPLAIADEMELVLTRGMMEYWYPRCIDEEYGGYLSSFDKDWKQKEKQLKFIVMQARHTWASAQMAKMYPDNPLYLKVSEHGYHYLRDVMWDKEYGGYYTTLNRQGKVLEDEDYELTKLAYGNAFAIYGLSAYYAASGDPGALEQAIKSFKWLDEHSYDKQFGGYFQFMLRDGTALKEGHRGTPPKDQNSSIHILEALSALYELWPDEHLKSRIDEMLTIIRDTITTEKGYMRLFFRQDWSPVYYTDEEYKGGKDGHLFDYISFGHDIETAFLMLEASHAIGRENDLKTYLVAKRMTDHTIKNGWDPLTGATYESAYYFKDKEGISILENYTQWWASTESFHTMLIMSELYPDDPMDYYEKFALTWDYCKNYLIDSERGGWYRTGINEHPWEVEEDKASIWKGNYHNARSLITCINILRKAED